METSDFLLPVDDNFLCSICQCVMLSPCACSEGHQFCRDCITTWLQRSPTCPQRCGDLAVGSLMKLRGVEKMINKLHVRCCHVGMADDSSPGPKNLRHRSRANLASSEVVSDAGCGWKGSLEERAGHLQDECAYAEVECSFRGCDAKVLRFQLAGHEASCEYREVCCDKCKERLQSGEMRGHMLECRMVEIECPQECGTRVLRGDVGEHEKICANVVVRCSFAEHGCEVRGKRKKVGEHEEEAVVAHARMAARRAGRERERNAELEEQLSAKTKMMAQFEQTLAEKSVQIEAHTQKTKELEDQVKKLQKELKESKRLLGSALQVAGRIDGKARVTWEIEGFTAKALAKEDFYSKVFHVQTKDGIYHLRLRVGFYRKVGSTKHGFMGLFVNNDPEDGGCGNYPVGVAGSKLTSENGATKKTENLAEGSEMDCDQGCGTRSFLSTDKIRGLKWTKEDIECSGENAPEYDVTDFLEDDTLTVSGHICITPPEDIDI